MSSVKKEMTKGVLWSAVGKYSGVITQLVITAVLARLISPSEFGVVAIATVLIAFLNIFADLGIGAAIIQRQDFGKHEYDAIFSFSVYLGLILALAFFFASYLVESFYASPDLRTICQVLSINLFIGSLNMVPNAIISKQKRFKFIAQRTLFFQFCGGICAICAAYHGWGCYSLLVAPILSAVGCFVANYRQNPLSFYPILDLRPVKSVFSYSSFLLVFNVMNYFTRNLDKLIIGRYFSLGALGYYDKSYHLMMLPLHQITHVITPVMHPVLASLQNNYHEMAENYAKIIKLLATISFPLGVFLYFAAQNMIVLVYGNQWLPSVPIFKILAFSVPVQMLISTTGGIYQASGRTDWLFYAGLFHTTITVIGFVVAALLFNDIKAMAWSFVFTMNLHTFLTLYVIYGIIFKESYFQVVKILFSPLLNAVLLIFILALVNKFLSFSPIVGVVFQFAISILLSLMIIHLTHQYNVLAILHKVYTKINIH